MLNEHAVDLCIAQTNIDLNDLFSQFADEPKIGLAVSGGPDSIALALLVRAWLKDRTRPPVHVYCVDHGLRPEAQAECAHVEQIANQLGFAFKSLKWQGPKPTSGIQAAAREARYRLIGGAMANDGVPLLLTGHHLQDQAETILMRLAHGSGLTGLKGMQKFAGVFGVRLARPLLALSKQFLQDLVEASGVEAVADPSNQNTDFERVRWRNILPQLAELGLTPERLSKFGARAARADDALEAQKGLTLVDADPLNNFGAAEILLSKWGDWPQEIKIRILQHYLDLCGGGDKAAELDQLELLVSALDGQQFANQTLAGCAVQRDANRIMMFRELGRRPMESAELPNGNAVHWDRRFFVSNATNMHLSLEPAQNLTRKQAEQFLGVSIEMPMDALASTLLAKDERGDIVCLGLVNKCAGLMVQPTAKLPNYLANMI